MGLPRIAAMPAEKPAQRPGRVRRLSPATGAPAWRMRSQPIATKTAAATQRSTVMKSPHWSTMTESPKIATSGQMRSPSATPTASGQALAKPPLSARAVSATQTGPGVTHRMATAPRYRRTAPADTVMCASPVFRTPGPRAGRSAVRGLRSGHPGRVSPVCGRAARGFARMGRPPHAPSGKVRLPSCPSGQKGFIATSQTCPSGSA